MYQTFPFVLLLLPADLRPEVIAEDIDGVRGNSHGAELSEGTKALENDGALEDYEHEEGEEGVVPVLVHAPEGDTEDLKDEEGGCSMLAEE